MISVPDTLDVVYLLFSLKLLVAALRPNEKICLAVKGASLILPTGPAPMAAEQSVLEKGLELLVQPWLRLPLLNHLLYPA